jgi:hypothetical protein
MSACPACLQWRGLPKLLGRLLAEPRLLACNGCLKSGLRAKSLCALLLQSCLLRRSGSLGGTCLPKLLGRLLAEPRLLACDSGLLCTKLADALCGAQLALLLLLKARHRIGLRLRVALVQEVCDRAGLLLQQSALHLRPLHTFTRTAKRTRTDRLCRQALLCDLALAIDLAHRLVDHLLLVRIHEGLSGRGIKRPLLIAQAADALLDRLLRCCKARLTCSLRGLLCGGKLCADTLL